MPALWPSHAEILVLNGQAADDAKDLVDIGAVGPIVVVGS